MRFQKAQTNSSLIWTWVTCSIFYDDNHYAKRTLNAQK